MFAIGTSSIPVLTEALHATNRQVRAEAAFILSRFSPSAGRKGYTRGWNVVMTNTRTNFFALAMTFGDDEERSWLIAQLDSSNAWLRAATAETLGWQAGVSRRAVPALEKLLQDPEQRVRAGAVWTLQQIGPATAGAK